MSIPVANSDLSEHIAYFTQHGGSAILLGANEAGQTRVWVCDPFVDDGRVIVAHVGASQRRLIATNPQATLVFPAIEPHGWTFIIDGHARVPDVDPEAVIIEPSGGMLHRPPAHADGPEWTGV